MKKIITLLSLLSLLSTMSLHAQTRENVVKTNYNEREQTEIISDLEKNLLQNSPHLTNEQRKNILDLTLKSLKGENKDIYDPSLDVIKISGYDIVEKFFNEFKGARLYYNANQRQSFTLLCSEPKNYGCERSNLFQQEISDFFIRDIIEKDGRLYFLIFIQNRNFYIDSFHFIRHFNYEFFFETPSFFSKDASQQVFLYIKYLINKDIDYKVMHMPETFNCNGIIKLGVCNENRKTKIPENIYKLNVLGFNQNNNNVNIEIARLGRFDISFFDFYILIQNGLIQKKSF